MVLSASSYNSMLYYDDPYHFFKRQLIWSTLGIFCMFVVMNVDYNKLKKYVKIGFVITILLLVAVLIPGVGKEVKGSTRWIGVGPLSFTPSEVVKLAIVFYFALVISLEPLKIKTIKGFGTYLLILGVIGALLLKQPDLGTTIAVFGTSFCMFIAAGAKISHLFALAITGILGVIGLIIQAPYRLERITGFWHLWENASDEGYQTVQSLYALGSGGLLGMGLGNSRQKFLYLPERHTDFIFAIIGEELGFIGAFLVLSLFFLFIWRGFRIAILAPDRFGSLLAVGLTSIIAVQSVINMGVVTGSLPVTGITLPFVSYGGSSLLFSLIGVGMLLNISKFSRK
ncbi:cell division-specific peptidoglycan biosynthesis regulator FtsW [Desulfonispora thiosulfatigenes DSM 11270]|uniref:Probable peptidoglycan glycosyltransferase FtsW n=1 Tax=Desulfonispora thiosulfatigenes DSM 11270 TaxID=656914 RepID=A0A1W1VT73_DESTI|nr:cell division-specific peptidoglycan biosynthesis regulator FtsW [Desulfonispora thiosulfatigenes DSM 11270]